MNYVFPTPRQVLAPVRDSPARFPVQRGDKLHGHVDGVGDLIVSVV